jgi:hypothetical protein
MRHIAATEVKASHSGAFSTAAMDCSVAMFQVKSGTATHGAIFEHNFTVTSSCCHFEHTGFFILFYKVL